MTWSFLKGVGQRFLKGRFGVVRSGRFGAVGLELF